MPTADIQAKIQQAKPCVANSELAQAESLFDNWGAPQASAPVVCR